MIDYKPSDLIISVPPFVDTMGAAECEHAALLIVLTCQHFGDEWQPVTTKKIGTMLYVHLRESREPIRSLDRNPFFLPDVFELVKRGYARFLSEDVEYSPIELTEKGLDALRPYVKNRPNLAPVQS